MQSIKSPIKFLNSHGFPKFGRNRWNGFYEISDFDYWVGNNVKDGEEWKIEVRELVMLNNGKVSHLLELKTCSPLFHSHP